MPTPPILAHEIIGTGGEKVIALAGWMGDRSLFAPLHPFLNTDAFCYAFADPRGYGGSKEIAGAFSVAEVAADVLALADHLGWSRFHFIGHSMMGKVAQYLCAIAAERLHRVVAVTPVPACKITLDEATYTFFSTAWENEESRAQICMATTGERNTKSWARTMARQSFKISTPEAFRTYFHMWADEAFSERMPGCKTPLLVMTGQYDEGVPTAFIQETLLQWLPEARLFEMPNAGHYPMQEAPLQFIAVCEEFLLGG